MRADSLTAPKVWRGRFFEDFAAGDVFRSRFGRTSENAAANLEWPDIKLRAPVFIGDTLWAESENLETRESCSNPDAGIVRMRSRGVNQRGEVVIEFRRAFMVHRRGAPQAGGRFPEPTAGWSV